MMAVENVLWAGRLGTAPCGGGILLDPPTGKKGEFLNAVYLKQDENPNEEGVNSPHPTGPAAEHTRGRCTVVSRT